MVGRHKLVGRLAACLVLAGALAFSLSAAATPSPARSAEVAETVLFASNRTGESAVYATDPVGGGLAQVATADAEHPVPAPDGSAVAFTRFDPVEGFSRVFVSRLGEAPLELPDCYSGDFGTGSWSPDSKHFACSAFDGIEVVSADGSSSYTPISGDYTDPAWSPDGKWIAFEGGRTAAAGFWLAPASGGKPVRLTSKIPDSRLAWSPDSKQLAFLSTRGLDQDLFEVGLTGAPARLLVRNVGDRQWDDETLSASWSPDSRRIAVGSERGLVVVNAASGAAQIVTHDRGESPAWSPDGSQIAYMVPRTTSEGSWDIAIVSASGSHRRFLTNVFPDGGSNVEPAWSTAPLANPLVRPPLKAVRFRPTRQVLLRTPVEFLATRGARAVLGTGGCTLQRWEAGQRPVRIPACAGLCSSGSGPDMTALLADQRIAWTCFQHCQGANCEDVRLAAPPYKRRQQVAFLYADDYDTGGDHVGTVLAAGSHLVFEIDQTDSNDNVLHRSTFALNPDRQRGAACPDDGGTETSGHTRGCRLIRAATNCALLDAASDLVVARCPNGLIRVLTGTGRPVQTLREATAAASARITGKRLVVLDGLELRIYDIRTGTLLRTQTLAADIIPARLLGASTQYAAYIRGAAIHLIRISDGTDLALRPLHLAGGVVAQLDNAGLIYGYVYAQGRKQGAVGFLSMASVRRLFALQATR